MSVSYNIIEDFYTEDRRIQGIVNEALENQRNKTIINLSERNMKPEEIAEVTMSSIDYVNEIIKKHKEIDGNSNDIK